MQKESILQKPYGKRMTVPAMLRWTNAPPFREGWGLVYCSVVLLQGEGLV
ncbi:hypothetical protein SAMN02982919_00992 [Giesbergeria anulus]|uniref:Uncharacterized protein n=1 Tax=Giesbergeria anulus TaxID=180197 RepID=A0A1H9I2A1_9BURK|nr:hypothetical protein SAMN02982919_00992 [Giesbergeria anulus]